MEPDELELLPAQQVLGLSAIAAYGLAIGSAMSGLPTWAPLLLGMVLLIGVGMLLAPGRRVMLRVAACAAAASTFLWLLVVVVAPVDTGLGVIHAIGVGGMIATALTAEFLWGRAKGRGRHSYSADDQADGPMRPPGAKPSAHRAPLVPTTAERHAEGSITDL